MHRVVCAYDIHKRIKNLNEQVECDINLSNIDLYRKDIFLLNNAKYALENWVGLGSNTNNAFNKALDIFCEVCMNEEPIVIKEVCAKYLVENVSKVRDAQQLANSIKYRNSRLKSKIVTKINNKVDTVSGMIDTKINNIVNSLKINSKNPGVAISTGGTANTSGAVEECFNMLLNECEIAIQCDRIISNYNKINNTFNINSIVHEMSEYDEVGIINKICECIDKYNTKFKNRYNSCLETTTYLFEDNYINYPHDMIVEQVTDYFLFNSDLYEENIRDVYNVMENSVMIDRKNFYSVSYLFENDKELREEINRSISTVLEDFSYDVATGGNTLLEGEHIDAAKQKIKDAYTETDEQKEKRELEAMMDKFRSSCLKNKKEENNNPMAITALKSMINTAFTKTPNAMVNKVPSFFTMIRLSFVVAATSIHPVLGLVTLITNGIIKTDLSRKKVTKVIEAYDSEIEKVKNSIEKEKDQTKKDNLQKYLDELEKDKKKLKEYENTLYSEDENFEREMNNSDNDFDDDDFDDDDFDLGDFEEAAVVVILSDLVSSINEAVLDNDIDGVVYNNIFKFDNDSINALADFAVTVPVILENKEFSNCLKKERDRLRETSNVDDVEVLGRISTINDAIYKLENTCETNIKSKSLKGMMCYLDCINEMTQMNLNEDYVLELSFSNKLKLAASNMRHATSKLKDKEKNLSERIDSYVANISKSLDDAAVTKNREAILKGRILPSASSTIKIALGLGVAWAINPAIAIISAIGGFVCAKNRSAKERQLVLDDIEIELKMCERYLKQAEDKNDLEAVRQIEKIQRNLQRQQQRIKYKMRIEYNQNVPNVANSDD